MVRLIKIATPMDHNTALRRESRQRPEHAVAATPLPKASGAVPGKEVRFARSKGWSALSGWPARISASPSQRSRGTGLKNRTDSAPSRTKAVMVLRALTAMPRFRGPPPLKLALCRS